MKKNGFTLLEMAVVVIIIGLVAGGILVGKEMQKSAKLLSVVSDVKQFRAAIFQFEQQYGAMPGDLKTATTYWPSATTQNGDGNGQINYNGGALSGSEEYYAWQHLSLAGLISGNYAAVSITTLPPSKLNYGFYRVSYQTSVYGKNGHLISLNRQNSPASYVDNAILSPADVYVMDSKYDDGIPFSGDIMGFNEVVGVTSLGGCVTNDYSAGASGSYYTTSPEIRCKVFFTVED